MEKNDSSLTLTASAKFHNSVTFLVTDIFTSKGNGAFSLQRSIDISTTNDNEEIGFYSSFGLQHSTSNTFDTLDKFIPGVLYNVCFTEQGNMPEGSISSSDLNFLYRDDRITLPVVMLRDKTTGVTFTVIDADSPCSTILADVNDQPISADYQFGGVGITKRNLTNCYTAVATWPGNDQHANGKGVRRHPIINGGEFHKYKVFFKIEKTNDYAESVSKAWNTAFDVYNPKIYETDLTHAYEALINTLDYYFLSPTNSESQQDVTVTAPGFPWSIKFSDFSLDYSTYELGFVGAQPATGFSLMREGFEKNIESHKKHGIEVIDFWANDGLSTLGFPKSRYMSKTGRWDNSASSIRQACAGFTEVLEAWCYYRKQDGTNKVKWIEACRKFGDWLVDNQNEDGSYYMEYNPMTINDGKHPVNKDNKNLTICAVRYLVELYFATNEQKYREAATKAAEWAYTNNHENYAYVACVIDNPEYVDSESGQQALQGFLSIYDLTKEQKWLDAAIQAATYVETFTFMHEVPVEIDQTEETEWPRDRSIVGQHLIAAAHSAADLGFAWSSFQLFRLYVLTGDEHWLKVARIAAHNSKQSMNLYQELYPGQQEGLQQEAFTLRTSSKPRRMGSILEALNWNFAAHLDPMNRFIDAYGSPDLEVIAEKSFSELQELDQQYSIHQSADYGDKEEIIDNLFTGNGDGLIGEYWEGSSDFGNPIPDIYRDTDFHESPEQDQPGVFMFTRNDPMISFNWGAGNPFNNSSDDESYSIKWTGYLLAPVTARYTFDLTSCDDAFSFKLFRLSNTSTPFFKYDNEYIGQPGFGWNWDNPNWKFIVRLRADTFYYLELLYFENAGSSHIDLKWQIEDETTFPMLIPQSQLYTELPDPSGILNADKDLIDIFVDNGSLHILDANSQLVAIYNIAGECIKFGVMNGNKSFALPNGIYIVKVGDQTKKIAII